MFKSSMFFFFGAVADAYQEIGTKENVYGAKPLKAKKPKTSTNNSNKLLIKSES